MCGLCHQYSFQQPHKGDFTGCNLKLYKNIYVQSQTFFLMDIQLMCNVVLESAALQSDSVIHIYIFFFSFIFFFILGYSVQSLNCVQLFATHGLQHARLSCPSLFLDSELKPMSIELVMPSYHLFLCHPPSPPALNLSQHRGL